MTFLCVQLLYLSNMKAVLGGNGPALPLQMRVLSLLVRSVLAQTRCAKWLCGRVGELSLIGTDDNFQDIT